MDEARPVSEAASAAEDAVPAAAAAPREAEEPGESPRPPRPADPTLAEEPVWEFAAFPWTWDLDKAQQLSDGWEPVQVVRINDENCLFVRRRGQG